MAIFPTHTPGCKLYEGRQHISAMACISSGRDKSPSTGLTVKQMLRPLSKRLLIIFLT